MTTKWTPDQSAEIFRLISGVWKEPTKEAWEFGWQGALGKFEARTVCRAVRELGAEWSSPGYPRPANVAQKCREIVRDHSGGGELIYGMADSVFRRLSPELQAIYRSRWREELAARAHEAAGRRADGRPRDGKD